MTTIAFNTTDKAALALIYRTGFTFKGDSHWNSYRQATMTLNRLVRLGLVVAENEDGCTAYRLTEAGKEAHLWPHSYKAAA